jgi:hypothetical protein
VTQGPTARNAWREQPRSPILGRACKSAIARRDKCISRPLEARFMARASPGDCDLALGSALCKTVPVPPRCIREVRAAPCPGRMSQRVGSCTRRCPQTCVFATLLGMTPVRALDAPSGKWASASRTGWRNGDERKAGRGMAEAKECRDAFRASCANLIPKGPQLASDRGYSGMPGPLKAESRCRGSRLRHVWFSSLTATAKGGRGDNHQNSAQA